MAGVPHATLTGPSPAGWERVHRLSSRILLPLAALSSLVLGGVLLLHPSKPLGPYAPFVLVAIGLASLATSSGLQFHLPRGPAPALGPSRAVVPDVSRPHPESTQGPLLPSIRRRSFSPNPGSDWRVLAAPASPGDETWLSWLPRESRRLGAAGGLSGSRTGYSPVQPGSLVAFPVQRLNTNIQVDSMPGAFARSTRVPGSPQVPTDKPRSNPDFSPTKGVAPEPPGRGSKKPPFSEDELDSMFPPGSEQRPAFLPKAPQRVGVRGSRPSESQPRAGPSIPTARPTNHSVPEVEMDSARPSVDSGQDWEPLPVTLDPKPVPTASARSLETTREPEPVGSEISLEAANPVPPHLRSAGFRSAIETLPSGRRTPDLPGSKSVCASCSKVVVNLRMSGPCPKCLRPICTDCLREALVSHGHGWCIDCSPLPSVVAS